MYIRRAGRTTEGSCFGRVGETTEEQTNEDEREARADTNPVPRVRAQAEWTAEYSTGGKRIRKDRKGRRRGEDLAGGRLLHIHPLVTLLILMPVIRAPPSIFVGTAGKAAVETRQGAETSRLPP